MNSSGVKAIMKHTYFSICCYNNTIKRYSYSLEVKVALFLFRKWLCRFYFGILPKVRDVNYKWKHYELLSSKKKPIKNLKFELIFSAFWIFGSLSKKIVTVLGKLLNVTYKISLCSLDVCDCFFFWFLWHNFL